MRERIVWDYEGTLVKIDPRLPQNNIVRPGAVKLLRGLQEKGFTAVLWTWASSGKIENERGLFPELFANFTDVYTGDKRPEIPAELAPDLQRRARRLIEEEGRKIPTLVGSRILVDDTARFSADTVRDFGFNIVNPNYNEGDKEPDEWTRRVARRIAEITGQ